jgi:hypothetical protein
MRISTQVSAVPTVSCLMPHVKVIKRKEPFSIILRIEQIKNDNSEKEPIISSLSFEYYIFSLSFEQLSAFMLTLPLSQKSKTQEIWKQ